MIGSASLPSPRSSRSRCARALGHKHTLTLHALPSGPNAHTQDPRAIRRCKRRVFDLHAEGRLTAWTDLSHGFRGVGQVADAVDYMLQGGHVGKVVIPIAV